MIIRQQRGAPGGHGGEFASHHRSDPLGSLGEPTPDTIARASASGVQVVYERDPRTGRIRIVVLTLDEELSAQDGAEAWVEEGHVLTRTPATVDLERIAPVIASQAAELGAAADRHEAIAWFLAEREDRKDPFLTRGERGRGGELPAHAIPLG